jgi:hypothetical protein
MLHIIPLFSFCPSKLMCLLKSSLDQNLMMIYHKFNSGIKNHINFYEIKERQEDDV